MSSLKNNNTWILSKKLTNCKAISCKWVFWTKRNAYGQIIHHKVRFIAKGYT
jgi:hypothetical protein